MTSYAFVLDANGKQLAPAKEQKAWFLIRKKRAALVSKYLMVIQLKKEIPENEICKDEIRCGIDDGGLHVGIALVQKCKTKNKVVFKGTIEQRNDVKHLMEVRRSYRHYHRYHKRYRPARFDNRKSSKRKKRIAPSILQKRQAIIRVIHWLNKWINITNYWLEDVSNDPRFYPDPLSKQEKYWLNKLGAIIEAVPGNPQNPQKCLYPQGRALQNFPNADWNVIGPKCANCRLLTLQNVNSISQMVTCLLQHGKVCTPVIAPNGGIKLGESALCPEVSNIYKSEAAIIQDIRQCTCQKCEIAWDNLKKVHPTAYYLCGGK